jgi:hypothetical protein
MTVAREWNGNYGRKDIEIRERTPTVYERSLLYRRVNDKRKFAREGVFCLKIQCSVKLTVTLYG